jgi:hypothetical protein
MQRVRCLAEGVGRVSMFDPRNLFTLPLMILGNFRHADWDHARKAGPFGIIWEFIQAATGTNTRPFFIPVDAGWRFQDVQTLLRKHGIEAWAVGSFKGEMHFSVKKRQGAWAQYVMLREGVPLIHGWVSGTRANPPGATRPTVGRGTPAQAARRPAKAPAESKRQRLARFFEPD